MTGTARSVIGVVTIGQTPRPDLVATFAAAAPAAEIRLSGALDDVAPDALAAMTAPGPYPLLVRLADGKTAEVPRDRLVPRVAAAAGALSAEGAQLIVVACAGEFPTIACPVPVLVPGRVVPAVVRTWALRGRIGVVTPNAAQVPFAEAKWRADGFDAEVVCASPVEHHEMAAAARRLVDADVSLVVLDCMGHDEAYRDEFARLCGRPVLAVQSLVAHLAAALV